MGFMDNKGYLLQFNCTYIDFKGILGKDDEKKRCDLFGSEMSKRKIMNAISVIE